uniref:Uncharacterized protein n=1 Tax=Panagrolaimus sp. PS1159 TaxID=55785 RepID=A0AC35F5A9_9BILA
MVVQLIAKDKNEKLQYEGRCKLTINSVSKLLLIEPITEEFKLISALFEWKFVAENNILFIFAEYDFQDFALVFDTTKVCKKVYKAILKKAADYKIHNLIYFNEKLEGKSLSSKKRSHANSSIIVKPNFELIDYHQLKTTKKRLFIFTSNDKTKCYEYYWYERSQCYLCCACCRKRKTVGAYIRQKSDGSEYVKLWKSGHICEMRNYKPDKYTFDPLKNIVTKHNFELFQYKQKGIEKKTLVIFCPTNKRLCYEYGWYNRMQCFFCLGCHTDDNKLAVTAIIQKNENDEDYIKLSNVEHICVLREFDSLKYKSDIVISKSMYEIMPSSSDGQKNKYLLVFTSADKKMCYKYIYQQYSYYCVKCFVKKHYIRVNICLNQNGEEYVSLQDKTHICMPVEYKKFEKRIIKAPDYQLIKRRHKGKWLQKLIVFTTKYKNYCYEYGMHTDKLFACNGCTRLNVFNHAKFFKRDEENEEEFVQLSSIEHVCEPQKYVQEDLTLKIVQKPNFKVVKHSKKGIVNRYLYIFATSSSSSSGRDLYYKYSFDKASNHFRCSYCRKRYVIAKLRQNENGEDYFELNNTEHECQPKQFRESNIVRLPNFKIETREKGKRHLFLFDKNNMDLCYNYFFINSAKSFMCQRCNLKRHSVTAKERQMENGEVYLELGENEHICKPEKYKSEDEYPKEKIYEPNFKIINDGKKLMVFDSLNKQLCYEYKYRNCVEKFVCVQCDKRKKRVTAKLSKNEMGEDYIELGPIQHICQS